MGIGGTLDVVIITFTTCSIAWPPTIPTSYSKSERIHCWRLRIIIIITIVIIIVIDHHRHHHHRHHHHSKFLWEVIGRELRQNSVNSLQNFAIRWWNHHRQYIANIWLICCQYMINTLSKSSIYCQYLVDMLSIYDQYINTREVLTNIMPKCI